MSAQRAWLDANMPKNGVLLDDRRIRPRETAAEGATAHGRSRRRATRSASRSIRATERSTKSSSACPNRKRRKARTRSTDGDSDEAPTPKKTRPEITHKGDEIIGALRTEALVKSLEVNACR